MKEISIIVIMTKITKQFIHLRTVSSYSLCFGANSVSDLVQKAKKEDMPALVISDKNNLFASLEFAMDAVKTLCNQFMLYLKNIFTK